MATRTVTTIAIELKAKDSASKTLGQMQSAFKKTSDAVIGASVPVETLSKDFSYLSTAINGTNVGLSKVGESLAPLKKAFAEIGSDSRELATTLISVGNIAKDKSLDVLAASYAKVSALTLSATAATEKFGRSLLRLASVDTLVAPLVGINNIERSFLRTQKILNTGKPLFDYISESANGSFLKVAKLSEAIASIKDVGGNLAIGFTSSPQSTSEKLIQASRLRTEKSRTESALRGYEIQSQITKNQSQLNSLLAKGVKIDDDRVLSLINQNKLLREQRKLAVRDSGTDAFVKDSPRASEAERQVLTEFNNISRTNISRNNEAIARLRPDTSPESQSRQAELRQNNEAAQSRIDSRQQIISETKFNPTERNFLLENSTKLSSRAISEAIRANEQQIDRLIREGFTVDSKQVSPLVAENRKLTTQRQDLVNSSRSNKEIIASGADTFESLLDVRKGLLKEIASYDQEASKIDTEIAQTAKTLQGEKTRKGLTLVKERLGEYKKLLETQVTGIDEQLAIAGAFKADPSLTSSPSAAFKASIKATISRRFKGLEGDISEAAVVPLAKELSKATKTITDELQKRIDIPQISILGELGQNIPYQQIAEQAIANFDQQLTPRLIEQVKLLQLDGVAKELVRKTGVIKKSITLLQSNVDLIPIPEIRNTIKSSLISKSVTGIGKEAIAEFVSSQMEDVFLSLTENAAALGDLAGREVGKALLEGYGSRERGFAQSLIEIGNEFKANQQIAEQSQAQKSTETDSNRLSFDENTTKLFSQIASATANLIPTRAFDDVRGRIPGGLDPKELIRQTAEIQASRFAQERQGTLISRLYGLPKEIADSVQQGAIKEGIVNALPQQFQAPAAIALKFLIPEASRKQLEAEWQSIVTTGFSTANDQVFRTKRARLTDESANLETEQKLLNKRINAATENRLASVDALAAATKERDYLVDNNLPSGDADRSVQSAQRVADDALLTLSNELEVFEAGLKRIGDRQKAISEELSFQLDEIAKYEEVVKEAGETRKKLEAKAPPDVLAGAKNQSNLTGQISALSSAGQELERQKALLEAEATVITSKGLTLSQENLNRLNQITAQVANLEQDLTVNRKEKANLEKTLREAEIEAEKRRSTPTTPETLVKGLDEIQLDPNKFFTSGGATKPFSLEAGNKPFTPPIQTQPIINPLAFVAPPVQQAPLQSIPFVPTGEPSQAPTPAPLPDLSISSVAQSTQGELAEQLNALDELQKRATEKIAELQEQRRLSLDVSLKDQLQETFSDTAVLGGLSAAFVAVDKELGGSLSLLFGKVGDEAGRAFIEGLRNTATGNIASVIDSLDTQFNSVIEVFQSIPGKFLAPLDTVSGIAGAFAGLNEPTGALELLTGSALEAYDTIANIGFQISSIQAGFDALIQGFQIPFDNIIGSNIQLQQELISTSASIAATSEVLNSFTGTVFNQSTTSANKAVVDIEQVSNAAQNAILALQPVVRQTLKNIARDSLELVGVTSQDLSSVFGVITTQIGAINGSLDDARRLTIAFAGSLGAIGLPLDQARQEIQSILSGTVDMNSVLAQTVGINNPMIQQWKDQGILVDKLLEKLEAFKKANQLAAQTIPGVFSNIRDVIENIGLAAGEQAISPITTALNNVFKAITEESTDELGNVQRVVNTQLTKFFSDLVGNLTNGLVPVTDAIGQLFGSLRGVVGNIVTYLGKSLEGGLQALGSSLSSVVEIFKPFLDIFASAINLSIPLGGSVLKLAATAFFLQKGILLLTQTFGVFVNTISPIGELLFLNQSKAVGLITTFTSLTNVVGRGGAGFLALGQNLAEIPGAMGAVTLALQGVLGPLAPVFASAIPIVSSFGIQLITLSTIFPSVGAKIGSFLALPIEDFFLTAAAALNSPTLKNIPVIGFAIGALGDILEDVNGTLSATSRQMTVSAGLSELLTQTIRKAGVAARGAGSGFLVWGAIILGTVKIIDELFLKNTDLITVLKDVGASVSLVGDTFGFVFDTILSTLNSIPTAIQALILFGGVAFAASRSLLVLTTVTTGLASILNVLATTLSFAGKAVVFFNQFVGLSSISAATTSANIRNLVLSMQLLSTAMTINVKDVAALSAAFTGTTLQTTALGGALTGTALRAGLVKSAFVELAVTAKATALSIATAFAPLLLLIGGIAITTAILTARLREAESEAGAVLRKSFAATGNTADKLLEEIKVRQKEQEKLVEKGFPIAAADLEINRQKTRELAAQADLLEAQNKTLEEAINRPKVVGDVKDQLRDIRELIELQKKAGGGDKTAINTLNARADALKKDIADREGKLKPLDQPGAFKGAGSEYAKLSFEINDLKQKLKITQPTVATTDADRRKAIEDNLAGVRAKIKAEQEKNGGIRNAQSFSPKIFALFREETDILKQLNDFKAGDNKPTSVANDAAITELQARQTSLENRLKELKDPRNREIKTEEEKTRLQKIIDENAARLKAIADQNANQVATSSLPVESQGTFKELTQTNITKNLEVLTRQKNEGGNFNAAITELLDGSLEGGYQAGVITQEKLEEVYQTIATSAFVGLEATEKAYKGLTAAVKTNADQQVAILKQKQDEINILLLQGVLSEAEANKKSNDLEIQQVEENIKATKKLLTARREILGSKFDTDAEQKKLVIEGRRITLEKESASLRNTNATKDNKALKDRQKEIDKQLVQRKKDLAYFNSGEYAAANPGSASDASVRAEEAQNKINALSGESIDLNAKIKVSDTNKDSIGAELDKIAKKEAEAREKLAQRRIKAGTNTNDQEQKNLLLQLQQLEAQKQKAIITASTNTNEVLKKQSEDRINILKAKEEELALAVNKGIISQLDAVKELTKVKVAQADDEIALTNKLIEARIKVTKGAKPNDAELARLRTQLRLQVAQRANLALDRDTLFTTTRIDIARQNIVNDITKESNALQETLNTQELIEQSLKNQVTFFNIRRESLNAGVDAATAEIEAIAQGEINERRKQTLVATTASIKLEALKKEQEYQIRSLAIEQQLNQLAIERQLIANDIAQGEAKIATINAQSDLEITKAKDSTNKPLIDAQQLKVEVALAKEKQLVEQRNLILEQSNLENIKAQSELPNLLLKQSAETQRAVSEVINALPAGQQRQASTKRARNLLESRGYDSSGDFAQDGREYTQNVLSQFIEGLTDNLPTINYGDLAPDIEDNQFNPNFTPEQKNAYTKKRQFELYGQYGESLFKKDDFSTFTPSGDQEPTPPFGLTPLTASPQLSPSPVQPILEQEPVQFEQPDQIQSLYVKSLIVGDRVTGLGSDKKAKEIASVIGKVVPISVPAQKPTQEQPVSQVPIPSVVIPPQKPVVVPRLKSSDEKLTKSFLDIINSPKLGGDRAATRTELLKQLGISEEELSKRGGRLEIDPKKSRQTRSVVPPLPFGNQPEPTKRQGSVVPVPPAPFPVNSQIAQETLKATNNIVPTKTVPTKAVPTKKPKLVTDDKKLTKSFLDISNAPKLGGDRAATKAELLKQLGISEEELSKRGGYLEVDPKRPQKKREVIPPLPFGDQPQSVDTQPVPLDPIQVDIKIETPKIPDLDPIQIDSYLGNTQALKVDPIPVDVKITAPIPPDLDPIEVDSRPRNIQVPDLDPISVDVKIETPKILDLDPIQVDSKVESIETPSAVPPTVSPAVPPTVPPAVPSPVIGKIAYTPSPIGFDPTFLQQQFTTANDLLSKIYRAIAKTDGNGKATSVINVNVNGQKAQTTTPQTKQPTVKDVIDKAKQLAR